MGSKVQGACRMMETKLMLPLALMLVLAFAGTSSASIEEGCGPLQRLRVKADWAAAYKTGQSREDFSLTVWNAFLRAHPEQRGLFDEVGGNDTRSAKFRAHMARVLGGVDAIISVLNEPEVLEEVMRHYSDFHKQFGRLPYEEFGVVLARVIAMELGRDRFGAEAWKDCFKIIGEKLAEAARIRQSPIDIVRDKTVFDQSIRTPWIMNYIPENVQKIVNNGHSIQVAIDYHGSELSGGPLGNKKFCLEQFHFHWGSKNSQGSEHTVEGHSYPAELHLVHWNCERYSSFAEAIPSEDGLAVLGVFLQVGDVSNPTLKTLTDTFANIHYKGQSVAIGPFNPGSLLPDDLMSFWNYPGSLTTPPYSETVNWVVFSDPITITQEQLEQFRNVVNYAEGGTEAGHEDDHHDGPLVDNYREPQPLFSRVIKASFS